MRIESYSHLNSIYVLRIQVSARAVNKCVVTATYMSRSGLRRGTRADHGGGGLGVEMFLFGETAGDSKGRSGDVVA